MTDPRKKQPDDDRQRHDAADSESATPQDGAAPGASPSDLPANDEAQKDGAPGDKTTPHVDATVEFEQPPSAARVPTPDDSAGKTGKTRAEVDATIELDDEKKSRPESKTSPNADVTIDVPEAASDSDVNVTADLGGTTNASAGSVHSKSGEPKTIMEAGRSTRVPGDDSDLDRRILVLWSSIDRSLVNTGMTIRSEEQSGEAAKPTNLVIQKREVRPRDAKEASRADYELLEQLGQGGMGVVYAARQASIDRRVAIKRISADSAKNPSRQEKFLSEAVVTGELDHPNIVPIYDLGFDNEGALFYSMKCVRGTPWSSVIGQKSLVENLDILMRVSDAVAFAHSRGVIHRDLKPENVMLGDFGEVLVMDWGLAVPIGRAASKGLGGTPAYMAPEMARGPTSSVGIHSDVYLLGAILFEILTGRPPHSGKDVMDCLKKAAANEIRPTSVQGELMDIALRAMSMRPEERYATVTEFQAVIRQHQAHAESIAMVRRAQDQLNRARTEGNYDLFSRALFGFQEALQIWPENHDAEQALRQTRLDYAQCALENEDFDLGLSLLTDDTPEQQELRQKLAAAKAERLARQNRLRRARRAVVGMIVLVMIVVSAALYVVNEQKGLAIAAKQLAEENAEKARQEEAEALRQKAIAEEERRKAENNEREAEMQRMIAEQKEQQAVAARLVAEKARMQADASAQEALRRKIEAEAAREKEAREAYVARIGLANAKAEENAFDQVRRILRECPPALRRWEWGRLWRLANQSATEVPLSEPLESVAWSPDGTRVAACGWNGTARVFHIDPLTCNVQRELTLDVPNGLLNAIAFSPDGKQLALGGSRKIGFLRLYGADDGRPLGALDGHLDSVTSLCFTEDGKRLVSTSLDHSVRIWNVETRSLERTLLGHGWWVWDAAISPSGDLVATASQDGTVMLWDWKRGTRLATYAGHRGPVYSVAWGRHDLVASAGHDQTIRLWRPADLLNSTTETSSTADDVSVTLAELAGHEGAVHCIRFDHEGNQLVSAADDNTVRLWRVWPLPASKVKTLRGHGSWVRGCTFSPEPGWVVSVGHDHSLRFWNLEGYEEQRILQRFAGHRDAVLDAVLSADGRYVFSASRDRTIAQWDSNSGQIVHVFREGHRYLATSAIPFARATRLVTAAVDGSVRGWEIATGVELFRLEGTGRGAAAAVSPDENRLATGGDDNSVLVWALDRIGSDAEPRPLVKLAGHRGQVTSLAFDRKAQVLASGDEHGLILLWNTADWSLVGKQTEHTSRINALEFGIGPRLFSCSEDRTAVEFDIDQHAVRRVLKHDGPVVDLAVNREGTMIATAAVTGRVRLWGESGEEPTWELPFTGNRVSAVAFSPDSARLAVVEDELQRIHVWDTAARIELRRPSNDGEAEPMLDLSTDGGVVWSAVFVTPWQLITVGGDEARLWDLQTGEELGVYGPQGAVSSVALSPDGHYLASSSWDHTARIWDVASGKPVRTLGNQLSGEQTPHRDQVLSVAYAPDGNHLATGSADGTAKIWNPHDGSVFATLDHQGAAVHCLQFTPDGSQLLTGADDGNVRVWDWRTGTVSQEFPAHASAVRCLTLSPSSRFLATGGVDRGAKIWSRNAAGGWELHRSLNGHTATVTGVAFSPDEDRLFTSSEDRMAKVWNVEGGQEILNLAAHQGGVTSVNVTRDGRTVVTTGREGQVILWTSLPWQNVHEAPGAD